MQKSKIKNQSYISKFKILNSGLLFCILIFGFWIYLAFAQTDDLEFTLDVTSNTIALPKIFKPNIDLSGRGFHRQNSWPQGLAAGEVLDTWQKDIGFNGIYRLQFNLWEINQLAKDKDLQDKLLANYESIIKKISDSGGLVILNIFGTPIGLGKVLDKKSAPRDLRAFKEWLKVYIRRLSCDRKYNIWYEVWNAPDLDEFFLGRKQEYFNLYRAVAQGIKELESETKVHIPLGGPSSSWWFQNFDGNTIVTPERSLIYEWIRFCYDKHLPLDFITWHGFSTDPKAEKEVTRYNKTGVSLIRVWLTYFRFNPDIPLIVDEWNFDSGANVLAQRHEKSNVCASYIPARIKNMYEAGIDYQLYFCLEDFKDNKEAVVRNTGIFWFDAKSLEYKGGMKSIYSVFGMLNNLGNEMFLSSLKFNDEFVGTLVTKAQGSINILIYNYIDPDIATNFLSRNIGSLNDGERKILLKLVKAGRLEKIMHKDLNISTVRTTNRLKALLKRAQELNELAAKFMTFSRNIKIGIKNLKESYLYSRYTIDSSCGLNCEFSPQEEKEIAPSDIYQEVLTLSPYSVNMVILKKKPQELKTIAPETSTELPTKNIESSGE